MKDARQTGRFRAAIGAHWPWILLALTVVPAVWHVVDFPQDVDPEFPGVDRPTFNRVPPPAYRLAEPGDTIDRVGLYLAAGSVVLAALGRLRSRERRAAWMGVFALSSAAFWYSSAPGPTFDGWHGLGPRAILDPSVPIATRFALGALATCLSLVAAVGLISTALRLGVRVLWTEARSRRVAWLLLVSVLLVVARQGEIEGVEPRGYWPRWAFVWGMLGWLTALIRILPRAIGIRARMACRLARTSVATSAWVGLVVAGVWLTWYHRPLERLREVEPGKIYISAMPTYAGLTVAQSRHDFRTIINIFPEDTSQRSPLLPQEERFVRERGIRYVTTRASDNDSDAFLDTTLALARDPDAWPILLHCHGCMDRSPAWMGIYRFLEQGVPLEQVLKEIEAHRGYRPKASITLLYNRVLARRAPERYRDDPTAEILRKSANGQVSYGKEPFARAVSRAGDSPIRP